MQNNAICRAIVNAMRLQRATPRGRGLGSIRPAKTGTSKDMRDNWAMGWSQRYTVGVWVGNASGDAMHDVSGTSGAAPIWASVMGFLHAQERSLPPAAPAQLVRLPVRFGSEVAASATPAIAALVDAGKSQHSQGQPAQGQPIEASRTEWFLPGTQQALFAINKEAIKHYEISGKTQKIPQNQAANTSSNPNALEALRIVAPTSGTIVALDPDIPPANQRLQLVATGQGVRWRIDGKALGQGQQLSWFPWPGRHVLEVLDAQGRVHDTVTIEVRGAGVVGAAGKNP
jgi:penicillin-binding protein 1C